MRERDQRGLRVAGLALFRRLAAALCLCVAVLLSACGDHEHERATAPPEVALDADNPSECAACHAAIVDEWRSSMHAHAHHGDDPLYAAMRRFRMAREGEALAEGCAQCHDPRDPEHPDSAAGRVGVGCASCHAIESVDTAGGSHRGARAITWAAGDAMRGPHDVSTGAPAPHGVGPAAPWIADGRTLCLTCHGSLQNAQGVDTCTTGAEYAEADGDRPCTSCHMPEVQGSSGAVSSRGAHRSHAFLGPHQLYRPDDGRAFMASAVRLTPSLEGTTLRVSMHNETQHAMPTGFPGRTVIVRATAYDASGEAVWQSFREDPMQEDPDAVLGKVYVDAQGAPTLPPYGARLARDTRLRPRETRELSWTVPESAVRAELVLSFRLLPPLAARRLGVTGTEVAESRSFLAVNVP